MKTNPIQQRAFAINQYELCCNALQVNPSKDSEGPTLLERVHELLVKIEGNTPAPEETVTVTYGELIDRAPELVITGFDAWFLSERGDKHASTDISKTIALKFMTIYEFEARKNKDTHCTA